MGASRNRVRCVCALYFRVALKCTKGMKRGRTQLLFNRVPVSVLASPFSEKLLTSMRISYFARAFSASATNVSTILSGVSLKYKSWR
jgi:hypothetical protein